MFGFDSASKGISLFLVTQCLRENEEEERELFLQMQLVLSPYAVASSVGSKCQSRKIEDHRW